MEEVLQTLQNDRRRDLYAGCDGNYWISYGGGLARVTKDEIDTAVKAGLLKEKFDDCYVLAKQERDQ